MDVEPQVQENDWIYLYCILRHQHTIPRFLFHPVLHSLIRVLRVQRAYRSFLERIRTLFIIESDHLVLHVFIKGSGSCERTKINVG